MQNPGSLNFLGTYPTTTVTPFTYREGATMLHIMEKFKRWAVGMGPEVQAIIDEALARFDEKIGEWQDLFDAFMEDVVAQLEALNDQAVANLVNNELSKVRKALDGLYADTTNPWRSHTFYGIHDAASLQSALNSAPLGFKITLPKDMVFNLGAVPLNFHRDVKLSGGTFFADDIAFNITADGVHVSDFTINGPGNHVTYKANRPAINISGDIDNYISINVVNGKINGQIDGGIRAAFITDFLIEEVIIDKFRYAGIALLSARDGFVTRCKVMHANQPGTLSYGIFASDGVNIVEHRSQNVVISHNYIHDIPDWEGLDTHGGLNISFIENTITKVRNAIVLGVGNSTRKTAPQGCRVIGNYIDGMQATPLAPENGILIGGSSEDNVNGALYADAIIVGNTILNVTVKTNIPNVMTLNPGVQSQRIDFEKSIVANNGGDLRTPWREGDRAYEETAYDTGWREATEHGSYASGYVRNSQWPLEIRVVGDHLGRTVFMRGGFSISASNPPPDNRMFRITHPALKPQRNTDNSVVLGTFTRNSNEGGTFVATFRTDDYIAHQFPTTPLVAADGYISMALTWRV